jgi:hypothetical protein
MDMTRHRIWFKDRLQASSKIRQKQGAAHASGILLLSLGVNLGVKWQQEGPAMVAGPLAYRFVMRYTVAPRPGLEPGTP